MLGPKWKDIPLSHFDFKDIFSRDSKHIHKTGSCIINLDYSVGNGTHLVATCVKNKTLIYFDSFCLPPPIEFVEKAKRLNLKYIYNYGHPIQDLKSVRCGYYCLYFLDNIHKKNRFLIASKFLICGNPNAMKTS